MSRILINPLNIPYQFQHYNKQASREAADPAKALDEDIRSCWCARGSAEEWYQLESR